MVELKSAGRLIPHAMNVSYNVTSPNIRHDQMLFLFKVNTEGMVHIKNYNFVIVYTPLCCSIHIRNVRLNDSKSPFTCIVLGWKCSRNK